MATALQENLAKEIVKNTRRKKPLNKGQLVELGGYSKTVAIAKPEVILSQKGVKDSLRKLGLTEELITNALVEDIAEKKGNRVRELALGADILGMTEEDKGGDKTFNITQIIINGNPRDKSNEETGDSLASTE